MQKIPTIFQRDPNNMGRVVDKVTPGCEWVFAGKGRATVKWDGTSCMVRDGKLYKRRELKRGQTASNDFEPSCCGPDPNTGKQPGWVPVGDGAEDKWHRAAFQLYVTDQEQRIANGTYELLGPKVQGDPYRYGYHFLKRHGYDSWPNTFDLSFQEIERELREEEREGIVWHHPYGCMAKIKRRDFGIKWPPLDKLNLDK